MTSASAPITSVGAVPQVKTAALKAVALDEMESEAHALLGLVAGAFDSTGREAFDSLHSR